MEFSSRALSAVAVFALFGCARSASVPSRQAAQSPTGSARLLDVIKQSGIAFQYRIPGDRPLNVLQGVPGGCAFLDYDGDGNLDILLISERVALYRGDGHGKFTDVSGPTGISSLKPGWWMGVAVGDYDNDGHDDAYISAYRGGILLHNEPSEGASTVSGRRFRDVTKEAGIPVQPWGTACTFGDYDNDGRLDLYVGNYLKFGPQSVQLCHVKNFVTGCSPAVYDPEHGALYHNEGHGRFRDVTRKVGLQQTGKVLGAVFFNMDGSGRLSLFTANDEMPSDMQRNCGTAFQNVGEQSGTGYTDMGKPYGGMGVDYGDINGDGLPDMAIGTFCLENRLILINSGGGLYTDRSEAYGIAAPMLIQLTFGTKLLDFDNDGWLDILYNSGYISDNIALFEPARAYRQPLRLFKNENGQRFSDQTAIAGPDFRRELVGRGLASGDFDNDGRIDALAADAEGAPLLLHNETTETGAYLEVRLVGTRSVRNAYGAVVTVTTGGRKIVRICHADGSFFSSSDPRVHVGLGTSTSASVTVHWPSGSVSPPTTVRANHSVTIREGSR